MGPQTTPITIEPGADPNEDDSSYFLNSDVGAAEWAKLLPTLPRERRQLRRGEDGRERKGKSPSHSSPSACSAPSPPHPRPRPLAQLAVHIRRSHSLDIPPQPPHRARPHHLHLLRLPRVHGLGAHLLRVPYHLPSREWEEMGRR